MDDDIKFGLALLIIGILFGCIVGLTVMDFIDFKNDNKVIDKLGTAICDQEYNLTFDRWDYSEEELVCKPIKENYDGLRVNIKDK